MLVFFINPIGASEVDPVGVLDGGGPALASPTSKRYETRFDDW